MITLEGHKVNPANDTLTVTALGEPGHGGACHRYEICGPTGVEKVIEFQNGPINEVGVNGITNEALLAILIDRLEGFESGPYAHVRNSAALFHLRVALDDLGAHTRERMARGVEGTSAT